MVLYPLTEAYLSLVLKWRNADHVRLFMYNDELISLEEHQAWFDKISNDPARRVFLYFENDLPLGLVQISDIHQQNKRCYWGFYIGEKDAPKGSGTRMGRLAIEKMFTELKLNKICAEVIATNEVSLHFHEKLGFKREGLFQQHIRKGSDYLDVIPMALFRENWLKGGEQ
ncbi:UDP-4-amino-4,6-dideoxy-N-acetyl-beta-L-altrosamine N-acetyltransferase [Gracilibacillus ureilyticus]|uniref:UDP-4-amino-4,6-dideoxy-N-acetyl-beta-L-altrosamine N-acetyltransferase n=2 Tax=Gracilibacillus ureilyticus TaxID=531814 RepID=A0A1H9RUG1_9BACI|nr:UDP-4-amino-4,6-dideoxy-N-acetyl-beta-L-altrosamine N-acetyltransferase [Gracilibacillus ureilyticus]